MLVLALACNVRDSRLCGQALPNETSSTSTERYTLQQKETTVSTSEVSSGSHRRKKAAMSRTWRQSGNETGCTDHHSTPCEHQWTSQPDLDPSEQKPPVLSVHALRGSQKPATKKWPKRKLSSVDSKQGIRFQSTFRADVLQRMLTEATRGSQR